MSESIAVKRQIVVSTIVTENFKQNAVNELTQEIQLIDTQVNHVQLQLNNIISQFQQGSAGNKMSISPMEAEQLINDLNVRLQQLINLKQTMQAQIENVEHANPGEKIITGSLENYVELKTGDNIYEKMLNREIVVKDGIIQEINC